MRWSEDGAGGCLRSAGSRLIHRMINDLRKGVGVVHSQVGEYLAVHVEIRFAVRPHELRVADALLARGRVDAGDPQLAEVALALAPIAVGVLQGLFDRVFCRAVRFAPAAPVALGHVQNFLATPPSLRLVSCAWHGGLEVTGGGKKQEKVQSAPAPERGQREPALAVQHLLDALLLRIVNDGILTQLALGLRRLLRQNMTASGFFALYFTASSFLEAFAGAAVRLHLRHRKEGCRFKERVNRTV